MPSDIVDLREFYLSPLGNIVKQLLRARLKAMWSNVRGESILALGYGLPLLRPLREQSAQLMAMMPPEQGVAYWPNEGPNISCFADMRHLPLADGVVDRVVMMHGLDSAVELNVILPEIWRVMKSGGSLMLIIPNRRGLWAHIDNTPFGTGEPYSSTQIRRILRDHGFLTNNIKQSLYMPPTSSRLMLRFADTFEKYGERLFPGFGGVLVAEAGKQLYAPLITKSRAFHRRLVLPLPTMPSGSPAPVPT
jgi:SAM-dependent methyltransferase